jgi:translocation and assembly module TamB
LLDNTAKTLGVDQFRISAESGYAGPEVSLSGYLGSNLMVRYGIGVFDGVNALALRYHLARNLYLEAISGTANSLDLLWSIERAR